VKRPSYARSMVAGRIVDVPPRTRITDGIAVARPHPGAFELVRSEIERVVEVSDDAVEAAMRAYFRATHNVAEGAGAVALAAVFQHCTQIAGKKVAAVVAPSVTPSDVAIETNGNIIVAGQAVQLNPTAFLPGPGLFALARYTPTGALDGTFGTGGKVVTSFGKNATAGIAAIAIDSEGRLVAVGNVSSGSNAGSIAVARYLTH